MAFDITRAQVDTPGCTAVLHLNNAGAALQPRPVIDAVFAHLRRETEIGGYEAAEEALPRREAVYHSVARLLGAHRDEIALVDNATRAFDMAFHALPLRDGDVILTTRSEYPSNVIAFLRARRALRLDLRYIPNDADGALDLNALDVMTHDPRVRVVSVSHVPTQSGLVQPVREVGEIVRRRDLWYLLDATQTAGQMPLNVQEIGCDALAATGRKFLRGPRATGFLYVRLERLPEMDPLPVDLHAATWTGPESYRLRPDARRFETWEQHIAGLLGLGAAVEYALGWGLPAIWERVAALATRLRAALAGAPNVVLRDPGALRCGIVTFTVQGLTAAQVKSALASRDRRINVSVSTINSAPLDFADRGLDAVVRSSVHYYLSEQDIDEFAEAVRDLG
ncbi:MAG: aminotransferase class V-fold PLP-dependent enzyme [Dehalococcoidia bacterium]